MRKNIKATEKECCNVGHNGNDDYYDGENDADGGALEVAGDDDNNYNDDDDDDGDDDDGDDDDNNDGYDARDDPQRLWLFSAFSDSLLFMI